jgi:hypothetical protein
MHVLRGAKMQGVTDVLAYGTAMHVEPSRKSR